MKHFLLSIVTVMVITLPQLVAQDITASDMIVISSGDTLFNMKIVTNKRQTNQDGIVYLDIRKQRKKLNASQVRSYYANNEFFISENIGNEGQYRLVSYLVGGYINFGISYTSNGEMNFYVKKDQEVIGLVKHKDNLKSFFRSYLEDFEQFYSGHRVIISYDYKTLSELISAYNAFKFPDKYAFEPCRNKEMIRIGLVASGGIMGNNLSGYYETKMTGSSFSLGIDFESRYSRFSSIHLPLTYNISKARTSQTSIQLTTFNFEPYVTLRPVMNKKFSIEIGGGVSMIYNRNSYMDGSLMIESDVNKIRFHQLSFGPNLSIIASLNRHLKTQLMFVRYQLRSEPIKLSSPESSSDKLHANNLRLMFSFYF